MARNLLRTFGAYSEDLKTDQKKWVYLIVLALIWGTSYILIKKGLQGFTPIQLGAVRILLAALFLGVIGFRSLSKLSRYQWKWITVSGFLGSFFPVFLFAYAQTEIDSGVTAVLNSMVPLFTLFIGRYFFGTAIRPLQLLGVIMGFLGAMGLILVGAQIHADQNYSYALLILIAAFGYACNANIIKAKLQGASPLAIATGNFVVITLPALVILPLSGFFDSVVIEGPYFWSSLGYLTLLCLMSTCIAKIMFNRLIQMADPVFSVSVTYLIPVVGLMWGLADGESFVPQQLLAAGLILFGVYMVTQKKTTSLFGFRRNKKKALP